MIKTIQINDDVHMLIAEKQIYLKKKGINKSFVEIADAAITAGIDICDEE